MKVTAVDVEVDLRNLYFLVLSDGSLPNLNETNKLQKVSGIVNFTQKYV